MSKPKSKNELQEQSMKNFEALLNLIYSFSEGELCKEFPQDMLNRNIRDVLGHLHAWHIMFLEWYQVGMQGKKPHMPAKNYTWKILPELNRDINKRYSTEELQSVTSLLKNSYSKLQDIIESHTNEELFEKKRYKWTGTTSLGAYIISNTSSHYNWAIRLIKKCMK